MNILFFGDSITWGAWDEEGGWVARIKKFVDKKIIASNFDYYHDIYNVGVSGDKTSELLARFEFEAKSRIDEEAETVVVFAVGVNDSKLAEDGGHRTPIEQFRENLTNLITKAKKITDKIVFVGLFPVDPTTPGADKAYKLDYVERYNQAIKQVCRTAKVDFVDMYSKFVGKEYKELLIDGLHPNTQGHKVIFDVVLEFLLAKKYI